MCPGLRPKLASSAAAPVEQWHIAHADTGKLREAGAGHDNADAALRARSRTSNASREYGDTTS